MLEKNQSILLVIDIQGKLAEKMFQKEILYQNVKIMIKSCQILDIPIIWLEQYPQGLGRTIPEIAELLSNIQPISKSNFSACKESKFIEKFQSYNRKQIIIIGIETHICIYQTTKDLLKSNYAVFVISDAVSSRTKENKLIGLDNISRLGGIISSTEMCLFELLKIAEGQEFRQISKLLK